MATREPSSPTLRRTVASRIALVLLPLLVVVSFLWSTSGAGSRLRDTEAAIVNLDQGATVAGHPLHLGQDYALELKKQNGSNFTWRYGVSLEEANAGLASGRFGAAVIIPPAFSRVLTGTAGRAEQATLQVERSPVSGVSDQLVTSQLSLAATRSLSGEVTKRYLDEVFVSTTELGRSLGHTATLAQAANTGATELQGSAQGAQGASADVTRRADAVAAGQAEVQSAAGRAAGSAREAARQQSAAADAAGATTAARDAEASAVAAAAAQAKAVAAGAGRARATTTDVAGRAADARAQGDATKRSADAVAAAAATSRTAAADYTRRVAGVVKAQQDIAGQLAQASARLKAYTDSTATVTKAVAEARRVVAAPPATAPAPPAAAPTAGATPRAGVRALPARPLPLSEGAQLEARAAELEEVAAAVDAVVAANSGNQPGAPAGLDAVAKAADANAAGAAAVLESAKAAQASNRAVVQAARDVAGKADADLAAAAAARTSATGSLAAVKEAAQAVAGITGTIRVPVDAPACPATVPPGHCTEWQAGYVAAATGIKESGSASIEGKAVAQARLADALARAAGSVDATNDAVAAATQTRAAAGRAVDAATGAQASLDDVVARATAVQEGAAAVREAVGRVTGGTAADVDGLKGTAARLRTIATQLTALAARLDEPGDGTEEATAVTQLKAEIAKALDAPEVVRAVDALPAQGQQLTTQAEAVTVQARRNAAAVSAVDPATGGADALATGTRAVSSTAAAQATVVEELRTTLGSLTTGMDALGTAIGSLGTQSTALSGRTAAASDQAAALAQQVGALGGTLRDLQAAAGGAASDAATAEQRAVALQQQVSALQQSSGVLSRSTAQVVDQSSGQVDRTGAVVHALEQNVAQVPTYDPATRQRLTTAASAPITTTEPSTFRNVGWLSMLLVLALWAGAMGLHSLFAPISSRAIRSTDSAPRLLAREMLPTAALAAAQGVAVAVAGQSVLHLPAGRMVAVTGALVLAALMFAAVNHTLVVFGRLWGRLLSVLFAIVTGSGLITQGYPHAMRVVRALSPISPALDLVRSLVTGMPMGPGGMLMLSFWLAAGCLFSALGILRARQPEPVRVPTVRETQG